MPYKNSLFRALLIPTVKSIRKASKFETIRIFYVAINCLPQFLQRLRILFIFPKTPMKKMRAKGRLHHYTVLVSLLCMYRDPLCPFPAICDVSEISKSIIQIELNKKSILFHNSVMKLHKIDYNIGWKMFPIEQIFE